MAKVLSSDDEAASAEDPEISRTTFLAVQQWINTPSHLRESQERALELYTLAPLLFGRSLPRSPAPSRKVLLRILKVAVPHKDVGSVAEAAANPGTKPEGYLTDDELNRIDFWKAACRRMLNFLSSMAPEQLAAHVTLWQPSIASSMKVEHCEALARQFVHVVPGDYPDDMCAVVSTFHHFATHIQLVAETTRFDDLLTDHTTLRNYYWECEKAVSGVQEKGKSAFNDGLYDKAVNLYTEALRDCPFSPVLYRDRALANLRRKDPRYAVSDGLRCVNLDPTYVEGMRSFAEALFGIGNEQLAFLYNQKARKACTSEDGASIQEQLERFRQSRPPDLPALVDSEDDSDDGENHDMKSKVLTSKQTNSPAIKQKVKVQQPPPAKPSRAALLPQQNGIAHQLAPGKDVRQPIPRPVAAVTDSDVWIGKLQLALAAGGAALLNEHYRQARSQFDDCIGLVTAHSPALPIIDGVSKQPVNVPLLRYTCGIACLRSDTAQDVNVGMEYFKVTADGSDGQKFPLAYYGLGQALMQLGRYHMARAQLISGLQVLSNSITLPSRLMWPGTNAVIPETCQLKSSFEDALLRCRYPPKADAICVYHECLSSGNWQREIYSFVYCFEGLVTVLCSDCCCMHYHVKCWQHLKSKLLDKTANKDVLGRPCFTPCCGGRISRIKTIVHRGGKDKPNEVSLPVEKSNTVKPKRPILKLPAQSVRAVERKQERKRQRRERRMEIRQRAATSDQPCESSALTTSGERLGGASGISQEVNNDDLRMHMTTKEPVTVLKKEKEVVDVHEDHHKHKNSKKKVKPKTVHLDEFIGKTHTDDETDSASIDSYGHTWLWVDHRFQASASAMYQPHPLQPPEAIGGNVRPDEQYAPVAADVIPGLIHFFEDLLRERGPLHVEDVVITRYLVDSFPPEALDAVSTAGGIGSFLKRYPQFGVVGDHLVLLSADGVVMPTAGASDEPLMITPRLMPGLPPPPRPPPLMSEEISFVSDWVAAAPHGNGRAYSRHATSHIDRLQPIHPFQAAAADGGRGEQLVASQPLLEGPAVAWATSVGSNQPASGGVSTAGSSSCGDSSGGYASTSASGRSMATRHAAAAPRACAVGCRASMLDGFDQPLGRSATASSRAAVPTVSSAAAGDGGECSVTAAPALASHCAAEPWPAATEERMGSSDSQSSAASRSRGDSATSRSRGDSATSSRSGSSKDSLWQLLELQQPAPPESPPPAPRCSGGGGEGGGSGAVRQEEVGAPRPASGEADFRRSGPSCAAAANDDGPWGAPELCHQLAAAGDAWSFGAASPAAAPPPSTSSSSSRWALAPGGPARGVPARAREGPVGGAAAVTAAVTVPLPPRPPLLIDAGVQVDGLRMECELLASSVQALGAELATVRAEQERRALEAGREREQLSTALQASQAAVSRVTGELARAEECVDGAREALGEHWSGGSGNDLADGIAQLRALLASEESARRAAEAARSEQAELTRRLQEELSSLRRRPLLETEPSSDELQQQCLRARRAEVTVLELRYQQAAAPLCALLHYCKQSLGRGGLLPSIANLYITYVERLSRSILELKLRYEDQIKLVAGGRLASTLHDIRVTVPMGSPAEQQILWNAVIPIQAIVQVPSIPKLSIPPVTLAGVASDVPHAAAPAAGQPSAARSTSDVHASDRRRYPAAASASATSSRTNDDRVLDLLVATYPGYSRNEHAGHLRILRAEREQGTLTGMTLRMVVDRVGDLISAEVEAQQPGGNLASSSAAAAASSANKALSAGSALPTHSRWAAAPLPDAVVRAAFVEVYQEESDPCIICHDPMTPDETTRLSCRHKYHSQCIKDWFEVQKTCPLCRNFDLMPEEFPDLAALRKA